MYIQHDRSVSKLTFLDRTFVDYHFSVVGFVCCGGSLDVVGGCSFYFTLMDYVLGVGAILIFCIISFSTFL